MKSRIGPKRIISELNCSKCGSDAVRIESYSDTVDFRGFQLDVENLFRTACTSCGMNFESTLQTEQNSTTIRQAYSLERDRVRKRDGLLSGDEILAIRKSFSLNQREAALLFGGGSNAFNKYETGEVLQSTAMDRLLRISSCFGQPVVDTLNYIVETHLSTCLVEHKTPSSLSSAYKVSIFVDFEQEGGASCYKFTLNRPNSINAVSAIFKKTTFRSEDEQHLIDYSSGAVHFHNDSNGIVHYNLREV